MTLPDAYKSQLQHIQSSPKYEQNSEVGFQPVPFPGYSVITPPWADEPHNTAFYEQVQHCQQQLVEQLPAGLVVPVPPESFHMTLADLIWDSAYRHASKDEAFDAQLRERIAESFARCQSIVQGADPISWQVIGLSVRTRAIALCLAPKAERAYLRVVELRRSIYQNMGLMALGIEQQYHFTGHITLGYFGDTSANIDAESFSTLLTNLNQPWLEEDIAHEINVRRAELRKFDDMIHYYRKADWPILDFHAGN